MTYGARFQGGVNDVSFDSYHNGFSRPDRYPSDRKEFVAWDGEGITFDSNRPQHYVLFGCSKGDYILDKDLRTHAICDFIIRTGRKYPNAIHVGFAFGYDMNMIVRSLHHDKLERLHQTGRVMFGTTTGRIFLLHMVKGKFFRVTERGPNYDATNNPNDKFTVTIYDIFGFFTTSFVEAYRKMGLGDADSITAGKAARGFFTWEDRATMIKYWQHEIPMIAELAEELRRRMYAADLRITSWYGPGALASYVNRKHGTKSHMLESRDEIREASRYAYMGGRFELFKVGRTVGPIYSMDINSAYPYAIAQLPSLTHGEWRYVDRPSRVARFGVYHVTLKHPRAAMAKRPSPLFHRDALGNISFPWATDGWYWSPEVAGIVGYKHADIIEGWEFIPSADVQPFNWLPDMYAERRRRKAAKDTSEYALKLAMNSLYGKFAQRVGWDETRKRIPPYHQLEWAGWVTSFARSMLYRAMSDIPWSDLIAVETDGIYALSKPSWMVPSTELGGWEIEEYDELMYVQSGLAFLRQGNTWSPKRRGLDKATWTLDKCENYLRTLRADTNQWDPYLGQQTRFITLGAALSSTVPTKIRHCRWETTTREIHTARQGKRVHIPRDCTACRAGLSAYDGMHELVSRTSFRDLHGKPDLKSYPHHIPWEVTPNDSAEDVGEYEWQSYQETIGESHAAFQ